MIIHKNTKLTPLQRKKVYDDYHKYRIRKCDLIKKYQVSRPAIDKILNRGRKKILVYIQVKIKDLHV